MADVAPWIMIFADFANFTTHDVQILTRRIRVSAQMERMAF